MGFNLFSRVVGVSLAIAATGMVPSKVIALAGAQSLSLEEGNTRGEIVAAVPNGDSTNPSSQLSAVGEMSLSDGTLVFSQSASVAVRVYTVNGQLRLNLYNKETGVTELRGIPITAEYSATDIIYRYAGEVGVEIAIAPSGEQSITINGASLENYATLSGTVFYLPRIALPSDAVIAVDLVEVGPANDAVTILASRQFVSDGQQVPLSFGLIYDPVQIDASLSYAVQAQITVDDEVRFITPSRIPVVTQGNPAEVELQVELAEESSGTMETGSLTRNIWHLQQIRYDDGTVVEATSSENHTISFTEDGKVNIQADCNRVLGSFTEDGNGFSITLGPSTLAACPPGSIDQDYLQALRETTAYFFEDGSLSFELAMGNGVMQFTAVPTTPELVGTAWQLQDIQYNNGAVLTPDLPEDYTVAFMQNGDIAVQADCNRGMGTFSTNDNQLLIGPVATTRVACPPGSIGNEFVQGLGGATTYFFQGDELFIDIQFDTGTMRFSPAANSTSAMPSP